MTCCYHLLPADKQRLNRSYIHGTWHNNARVKDEPKVQTQRYYETV